MSTVIQPSVIRDGRPFVNAKQAKDLQLTDIVTNMGIVDGVSRHGVFVVVAIRGTLWSTAVGKGDVCTQDVVWHESEEVTVDAL